MGRCTAQTWELPGKQGREEGFILLPANHGLTAGPAGGHSPTPVSKAPCQTARPCASQMTWFETCLWLHTASQHRGGQHEFMATKRRGPKTQGENTGVTVSAKRKSPDQEFTALHVPCANRGESLQRFTQSFVICIVYCGCCGKYKTTKDGLRISV